MRKLWTSTRCNLLLGGASLIASSAILRAQVALTGAGKGTPGGVGSGVTGQVELIGTQISSGQSGFPNLLLAPQKFSDLGTWSNITAATDVADRKSTRLNSSHL